MNKQELIKKIAAESEVSQKEASTILDNALNAIVDAVAAGEKVQLIGFGSFEPKKREARVGRNPKTKEAIEIPASIALVFKPGKEFKEKVKG